MSDERDPTSWDTALEEAERESFDYLCELLGVREGQSAFIGANRGVSDCIVFDIGYPETGEMMGFPATTFHFRGSLDLYSRSRAQVQRWFMRLLRGLPVNKFQGVIEKIDESSCVEVLRIAPMVQAFSGIEQQEIKANPNSSPIVVYAASVQFDIVFNGGERADI